MTALRWLPAICLLLCLPLHAATFRLIDQDQPGIGLNDPTPFTPVGGNDATTLGQARVNAFNQALQTWGDKIVSSVAIRVTASFAPLACTSNTATLAQAGPVGYFMNFPHAPLQDTFYPSALANALAGTRLNRSNNSEIDVQFNGALDSDPQCLDGRGYYYGYDHMDGNKIDFPDVLMHEIGHGLGFISLVVPSTGRNLAGTSFVIFDHFVLDLTSNKTFDQMTASERAAAAVDSGNLVWAGPNSRAQSSLLTDGVNDQYLQLYAPATVSDGSSVSHWDTAEKPDLLMQPFVSTDVRALQSVDFTTCALEDMGWTLTSSSGCPDPVNPINVTLPHPYSPPDTATQSGGGGAVDPAWLVLLMLARFKRRRSLVSC